MSSGVSPDESGSRKLISRRIVVVCIPASQASNKLASQKSLRVAARGVTSRPHLFHLHAQGKRAFYLAWMQSR